MADKLKCYELDFGDMNLITQDKKQISEWVEAQMEDMGESDELEYTITIKMLTPEEYANLPEWS